MFPEGRIFKKVVNGDELSYKVSVGRDRGYEYCRTALYVNGVFDSADIEWELPYYAMELKLEMFRSVSMGYTEVVENGVRA